MDGTRNKAAVIWYLVAAASVFCYPLTSALLGLRETEPDGYTGLQAMITASFLHIPWFVIAVLVSVGLSVGALRRRDNAGPALIAANVVLLGLVALWLLTLLRGVEFLVGA